VRILPEQLLRTVSGEIGEDLVCEHNGVPGKRRIRDQHRHAREPDRLDEDPTSFPKPLYVTLGLIPGRCAKHAGFEIVQPLESSSPGVTKPKTAVPHERSVESMSHSSQNLTVGELGRTCEPNEPDEHAHAAMPVAQTS
jgi:hypothetical protein